jgi:hypothetical protein
MNMTDSLTAAFQYFRRHVSQEMISNERLILLLGAGAVLVVLSGLYGFWSLSARMGEQLTTSKTALARLQAEATGDAWPKRVETSRALKTQLRVRLWDAPTPGLAEASFENWLRTRFSRYGGEPQQIQITRSPAGNRGGQPNATLAGVQRMTAKVLAPFDQTAVMDVLADAAESDKLIVVDRLIVRAGTNSRIEMDVSTFIQVGEARAGAKGAP